MRIKRLPEQVINRIAAGEVVERPASVLKELVENSLDAQATQIQVKVEKGGKRLVEVRDNGIGIHPDDVMEAVGRFSTSKINSFDDLYAINTYGFRGEALSSISSVSRFSLITRQEGLPLGRELLVEGGVFRHLSDTGAPTGTTVRVKDLFFNLPVRERFLKSERTELNHIIDTFTKYAVYHHDKHFSLTVDGKTVYSLPPADVEERIRQVFPKAKELVRIREENGTGKVEGFFSPDYQPSKGYIYINGRPVKNSLLKRIITSKLGKSFFVLFLELPPYQVDFNVHPSKTEVKFRREEPVYRLVKEALEKPVSPSIYISQPDRKYGGKFEVIGQIDNTFLVVHLNGEVYFVDQHVAEERINYELLKRKYRKGEIPVEKINPVNIPLDGKQMERLEELGELLEKAGFRYEKTDGGVKVFGVASYGKNSNLKDIFLSILNSEYPEMEVENLLGEFACKLSVEAGELLEDEEAKNILRLWLETDNPNLCPHGRPIYYKIPLEQIKKKVGRK
ncbi:MAG: DNA mismatch repair endonuclease MutL [Aquificae bacterium]|nr:DNA mismatch repair endonuclease MutL [Aquificota bacterium]